MNRFTERYKTFSNTELFSVLEREADYEPEAVEAAKAEIKGRNLSDQELKEVTNDLETEKRLRQEQEEKKTEVEKRVKNIGASIFEAINPIQESTAPVIKQIRWITLVFGLIAIFRLYQGFGMIEFIQYPSMIGYFLTVVLLPVAVFLFAKGKVAGWVLLAAYVTYSAIDTITVSIAVWNMGLSGASPLDQFSPQMPFVSTIGILVFFVGALLGMAKKEVRTHFNISSQLAIGTILVVTAIQGLYVLYYLTA